jgi:hypothetical protein
MSLSGIPAEDDAARSGILQPGKKRKKHDGFNMA